MNELRLSVVLPAHNEEDCIIDTIREVRQALESAGISHEIIVVDDGSKDRTAERARSENIILIQHRTNLGVGAARKSGIARAKAELVATTDVDGTYPNQDIPHLLQTLQDHDLDMVIGARIGKNVVREWPHRWIPKFLIRRLASYLCQRSIPDLNSGLRIFKKSMALDYFYLLPDSHSWESTITLAFLSNKKNVEFVPIDYYRRKGGKSSFAPVGDTYNYLMLVVRTTMYFNPLRIFIPVSLFLMLIGLVKTIYDWEVFRRIGSLDVIIVLGGMLILLVGLIADLIVVVSRKK